MDQVSSRPCVELALKPGRAQASGWDESTLSPRSWRPDLPREDCEPSFAKVLVAGECLGDGELSHRGEARTICEAQRFTFGPPGCCRSTRGPCAADTPFWRRNFHGSLSRLA